MGASGSLASSHRDLPLELMRQSSNQKMQVQNPQSQMQQMKPGQPNAAQPPVHRIQEIGATSTKRYFTKTRINETMFREIISWLGLLASVDENITMLKRSKVF